MEKLSDTEEENEEILQNDLHEPNLFNIDHNDENEIEYINDVISDEEMNENENKEKYFIKTLPELTEEEEENNSGYNLLYGLTPEGFFKSFEFKKVDDFEPKNKFIRNLKTKINIKKGWYIVLFGNICLKKYSQKGLNLNEKFCFEINESNELLNIPISCQPNCEIDFIESKNKKYICLRTIKNLKSGESL